MNIVKRVEQMMDFTSRDYHAFVLSHEDADAFLDAIERATGRPVDRAAPAWTFRNIKIIAANIRQSYAVEGWEQPMIHFI